ncbi:MAG: hypothetical protein AAF399_19215, partial [Bacteroidota bacterium]
SSSSKKASLGPPSSVFLPRPETKYRREKRKLFFKYHLAPKALGVWGSPDFMEKAVFEGLLFPFPFGSL